MMSGLDRKSKQQLLEKAWDITVNNKTFDVHPGDVSHTPELLNQAMVEIQNINKADWWPIAEGLYDAGDTHDSHGLAEKATTIFINKKLNTSGLQVSES